MVTEESFRLIIVQEQIDTHVDWYVDCGEICVFLVSVCVRERLNVTNTMEL